MIDIEDYSFSIDIELLCLEKVSHCVAKFDFTGPNHFIVGPLDICGHVVNNWQIYVCPRTFYRFACFSSTKAILSQLPDVVHLNTLYHLLMSSSWLK